MGRTAGFRALAGVPALLLVTLAPAAAQDTVFGGSFRAFQFVRVDPPAATDERDRRDTELGILRLTGSVGLGRGWRINGHGVVTFLSPPRAGIANLADAGSPTFLPLDGTVAEGRHGVLLAGFDRLNVQGTIRGVRVVAGRQAITWGTNFFWPALDLFAPFNPSQIDRDYKPGVDALRVTVPLGDFSEVEAIGGVLGSSIRADGAVAALARIHLGRVDVGPMVGRFHDDTVVGGFVTADVHGTGVRGELTRTYSGDPDDVARERERFWRGSVGIDRLLTPVLTLTAEVAWNGYGFADSSDYSRLIGADRLLRGEVNALGRHHAGLSLAWEIHPLWMFTNTALANLNDGSVLWVPAVRWSTSDNTEVLFGAQVSFGPGLDARGAPRTEYGLASSSLLASFKGYF